MENVRIFVRKCLRRRTWSEMRQENAPGIIMYVFLCVWRDKKNIAKMWLDSDLKMAQKWPKKGIDLLVKYI